MPFGLSKRIRSSISLRMAFLFFITFTMGLALAFVATYIELRYSLERTSRELLAAKLQETKAILSTDGVNGLQEFLSTEKNRSLNLPYMFRVFTSDGETLYLKASVQDKNFDFAKTFNKQSSPEAHLGWQSLTAIDDEDNFNILTEKTDDNLYLQVGSSNEEREGILEEILLNFGIIEVILVLMSAVLGVWYAKKSLAPIRGLLTTIRSIEHGNLSQRVPLSNSNDELQDLGETFNRMIARIERLILMMRESVDSVAHDIKTPLTRIKVVAEDALLSEKPSSHKEALEDCAEGATNISALVDQLLSISEADAGTLILRHELCQIDLLFQDVVEIYEFVALEKEITIVTSVQPPGLTWSLDRKRVKQVVANLLDNAIKFSPAQTSVHILADIHEDMLRFSIKDQGEGIPEADIPRVWDRLFRGDKSRSTKGSGLGLSIVRSVVTAHGGSYEARKNFDRGMSFAVIFPKETATVPIEN